MTLKAGRTTLLSVIVTALGVSAEPMGRDINPGVLGPNALPTLPSERPWVRDGFFATLGWAGQLSTPHAAADWSMLVPFRLEAGLFGRVAFAVDGSPFELFQYSPETRDAWQPRRSKGITRGDVRLSSKVLLLADAEARPAIALRATLKTATGEDLKTRRFLDAPAYQFDALAGWRRHVPGAVLEAWALVGFLAWQQGAAGQNDALTWAATMAVRWPLVWVRAEARGFMGWLRNDAPTTLAFTAELLLTSVVELVVGTAATLRDPTSVEVSAALRLRWPDAP